MTKPNTEDKYCSDCSQSQIRWQFLISCENYFSTHYKHVLHRSHPACKKFIPRNENKVPK